MIMLPSTGKFKEISCPFFDSGLCERPYCHFRHIKKDLSENLVPVNPALTLGEGGEILQQLVSEAVIKVLRQTDILPGALGNSSVSDPVENVSHSLVNKVVEVLAPSSSVQCVSQKSTTGFPSQSKVPSYKPTPISVLKRRHIPIPYSPSLSKTSGILPKRPNTGESPTLSKKLKLGESDDLNGVMKTDDIAESLSLSVEQSEITNTTYESDDLYEVDKDSVCDSHDFSQYSPVPLAGWKDVKLNYTPSSIESLSTQQNSYVPVNKSNVPSSSVTYEPSDKLKVSTESTYQPVPPSGSSVADTTYEPSSVNKLDNGYQPVCEKSLSESLSEVYVPTDKSKLDSVSCAESSDLNCSSDIDYLNILKQELNGNVNKVSIAKTAENLKGNDSETNVNCAEKTVSCVEKSKNDEKRKSDSDKKESEEKKLSEREKKRKDSNSDTRKKTQENKERNQPSKKRNDSEKEKSINKKRTKKEKRSSDKKSENIKDYFREKKNDGIKIKSDSDKKSESRKSSDEKKHVHVKKHNHSSNKMGKKRNSRKDEITKSKLEVNHKLPSDDRKCDGQKRESINDKKKDNHISSSVQNEIHIGKQTEGKSSSREKRSDERSTSCYANQLSKSQKSTVYQKPSYKSKKTTIEDNNYDSESSGGDDILDSVTLPNDTWASSSDEETVTKECFKIFQEYEPKEADKKTTSSQPPQVEKNDPVVIGKKRVAHEGAQNYKQTVGPVKRPASINPVQVLYGRFQKVKESRPVVPTNTNAPNTSLNISKDTKSPDPPTPGGKVRIAHVPNVSLLLNAKMKVQQKIKERGMTVIEEISNSIITQQKTVSKGSQRVAHVPSERVLARPVITSDMRGKIPSNVRQNYLNMLVDEFLKICASEQEAYDKAVEEEKTIYARSTTRITYASHVSNTIGRLRKNHQIVGNASSSKSCTSNSITIRTVSHTSVLAGKGSAKGSWSIEKPRKPPPSVSCKPLYEQFAQFILSEDLLKQNGFPFSHPEEKGVAVIHAFYKKPFVPKTPQQRMCARCSRIYFVNQQSRAVKDEQCVYHWGRLFQSKTLGGWEARYNCCQGHAEAIGCSVGSCHVSDNFDPNNLRGFVKTLPKDNAPPDGDYGVYALDCEMCYTTVGLELTRVTVIGTNLEVVYESLVKPESPVLDYNTRFSGIKEEDLSDVTTSIYEVQSVLLSFVNDKTILVGHSLESDFKALKLIHGTVVDTSVVYPHKMGPPKKRALKSLCRELLHKIIQESEGGHDSAEDARAAMELMLYRLKEEMKNY